MSVRRSGIGYTDFSGGDLNFIIGCTPVSTGCANCYARRLIEDRQGRDFSQIRLYPDKLRRLAKTKFRTNGHPFRRGPGSRPLVFPIDLGDIFHEAVPDQFLWDAFSVMLARYDVDWLILSKRSARMLALQHYWVRDGVVPPHIWPGVTVEDSDNLWRIEDLLRVPAAVRWLSIEPMLSPIQIPGELWPKIDWVVIGAESGPNRRSFDEDWARDLIYQCTTAGVPIFYKQGSHRFPGRNDILDGCQYKEFPRTAVPLRT